MAITTIDVEKVIPGSDLDTQTYIDMTQCIMDQYDISGCYADNCANAIHIYLTAHFIAVSDPNYRLKAKEVDEVKDTMQDTVSASVVGELGGLHSTIYGQNVMMFDSLNKLADIGNPNKQNVTFCAV